MANIIKRNNGNVPTTFNGLVDKVFHNGINSFFNDDFWGLDGIVSNNQVPVNIRETDKSYEMEVAVPGLRKEDFTINVDGDLLTVSFEHKEENKEENKREGWLRREYGMQSFSRSFRLDDTVNADSISAKYADGILHLSLPKKEGVHKITKSVKVK